MNRRISRKMKQSSVELSLNNGIINSQPNWSRCNSFSSSSSDSTLYCSNSSQRSSFSGRKRLNTDEPIGKVVKRSRNSSGSSASSNLSCISDKEINRMPTLLSSEQVTHGINNIEALADISTSTLELQHEALLKSRLSHPLDMKAVLPFRHNLRRNIRKKTCSCDCTATCTTVVVSRQYKGTGEQTVEEKTVISRTKVKTFVDSSATQAPFRQVQVSSKVSFQENLSTKNECSFQENQSHENECSFQENATHKNESRRRRPEIERLYDSLHEIKWAKNFSPDNILRQFDVRHAASCSAFGKSPGEKPTKNNIKKNKCSNVGYQNNTKPSNESSGNIKLNKPNSSKLNNSYTKQAKIRTSLQNEDDSNPPLLEKSLIIADETLDVDSPHYNTYPVLSKEILIPEKETNTIVSQSIVSTTTTCNTIQTDCTTNNNLQETGSSLDLSSQCNIDDSVTDCSSTFFDITEDNIHTIDACFEEVGAEVVVSTSCDNDSNNLPLMTAVKDIHSSNIKSISLKCPPVLKKVGQRKKVYSLRRRSEIERLYESLREIKWAKKISPSPNSFFPPVNSQFISNEDFSLPLHFLEDCKRNYAFVDSDESKCAVKDSSENISVEAIEKNCAIQSFCDINSEVIVDYDSNTDPSLPSLVSGDDIKTLDQKIIIEPDPPVLEPCISNEIFFVNIKSKISITENIKNEDSNIQNKMNKSSSDTCFKSNCNANRTNNILMKSKKISQIYNLLKSRLRSKSLVVCLGRHILKKYLRFVNSKSKRQNKLSKLCNRTLKKSAISQKASPNTFCNVESIITNNSSLPVIPLSPIGCIQMPPSDEIINALTFSPSQITDTPVNKTCISSSESCIQSMPTESTTVIQSFNQKLSFSTSDEDITVNQIKNSSLLIQTEKKPCFNNKKGKKPSFNSIFNNHHPENFADIPGYVKILSSAKKKEGHAAEKTKVPPRVFTCHFQTINVTRDNDYIQIVLKITRGKSIFLTHETLVELKEAIIKAGNDKDCRQLILNGFGQTFCLGLDLKPLVGENRNQVAGEIANAVKDLIGTLAEFRKPLVAIVNGAAFGLGLTILNHADVTIATSNASFCMPYSRLGYMPEGGATLTLPQAVGTTVAMDLILRGQVITAEQARDIGLINEVVEVRHLPQDLVSRVQAIAQKSLPGMEATKAMMKLRLHIQLPLVLETEAKLLPQMWLSPSCQEAIQSVLNSGFFEDC